MKLFRLLMALTKGLPRWSGPMTFGCGSEAPAQVLLNALMLETRHHAISVCQCRLSVLPFDI